MPYGGKYAKERHALICHLWKLKNPDKMKVYRRRRYWKHRDKALLQSKEYWKKQRLIVLEHYGGSPPKCDCCGEKTYEFLALDHVNGKGRKDRLMASKGYGGSQHLHRQLIKSGFPKGFRVLCHNCNCSRGYYGFCPHERKKN